MKLTTVTVGLTRTVSLPDYCNVKPSIAVTAELAPDDDLKRTVAALDASCRAYIEAQVDDALEHEGQSPRFYAGPLYHAHRWDQAHAVLVFKSDVDVDALPGDWHTVTPQPVRKPAAIRRAAWFASNRQYEVWDWADLNAESALEWWNNRTWYVARSLHRWVDHWDHEPAKVVIIPYLHHDWETSALGGIGDDSNLGRQARQLEEILPLIEPLPWVLVEDEDKLRTVIADWEAANPRPSPDAEPSDHEADDNSLPEPDPMGYPDGDPNDLTDEQPGP